MIAEDVQTQAAPRSSFRIIAQDFGMLAVDNVHRDIAAQCEGMNHGTGDACISPALGYEAVLSLDEVRIVVVLLAVELSKDLVKILL